MIMSRMIKRNINSVGKMEIKDFIAQIRAIRIAKGVSQNELARRTGLFQPIISRFEKGESNPKLSTVLLILKALDCELEIDDVQAS